LPERLEIIGIAPISKTSRNVAPKQRRKLIDMSG
jgi:hypothetical protein